jgi:heme exporter protein C
MANWTWFHRLGSPKWFYDKTTVWLPWLAVVTALLLVVGLSWGLGFAPLDAKQGNSFRIIYIHVPASFLALAGYYIMAISGAVGLIWKMKIAGMMVKSAAPIGAVLTAIALITGSIWGKPTWGTYWVWEARITSMLVLFFLYLGVIALQESFNNEESANKASAVLALVGMVNIPIIYKSVDWWNSLHQPATIKLTSAPSMHPDMFHPLVVCILGFYCFYTLALILATRSEILHRERRTKWVRKLLVDKSSGKPSLKGGE